MGKPVEEITKAQNEHGVTKDQTKSIVGNKKKQIRTAGTIRALSLHEAARDAVIIGSKD